MNSCTKTVLLPIIMMRLLDETVRPIFAEITDPAMVAAIEDYCTAYVEASRKLWDDLGSNAVGNAIVDAAQIEGYSTSEIASMFLMDHNDIDKILELGGAIISREEGMYT